MLDGMQLEAAPAVVFSLFYVLTVLKLIQRIYSASAYAIPASFNLSFLYFFLILILLPGGIVTYYGLCR